MSLLPAQWASESSRWTHKFVLWTLKAVRNFILSQLQFKFNFVDGQNANGMKFSWKEPEHSVGISDDLTLNLFELVKHKEITQNIHFISGTVDFPKKSSIISRNMSLKFYFLQETTLVWRLNLNLNVCGCITCPKFLFPVRCFSS